jgi:hypothetical protein
MPIQLLQTNQALEASLLHVRQVPTAWTAIFSAPHGAHHRVFTPPA